MSIVTHQISSYLYQISVDVLLYTMSEVTSKEEKNNEGRSSTGFNPISHGPQR